MEPHGLTGKGLMIAHLGIDAVTWAVNALTSLVTSWTW
jgi:hypothetical protein